MASIGDRSPGMFDNVWIRPTAATVAAGVAGLQGQVYGLTTPSVTGVTVIGESTEDCAYCIHFEALPEDLWLAPELVEFVSHAPGRTAALATPEFVRRADGSYVEKGEGPRRIFRRR